MVILDTDSKLWSFGTNSHGELGHNTLERENRPKFVEFFSSEDIKKIIDISVGGWHSCALTGKYFKFVAFKAKYLENGDVYGWGWNQYGQLGNDEANFFKSIFLTILVFIATFSISI